MFDSFWKTHRDRSVPLKNAEDAEDTASSISSGGYLGIAQTLCSAPQTEEGDEMGGGGVLAMTRLVQQLAVRMGRAEEHSHRLEEEKQRMQTEVDMVYQEVRTERDRRVNMSFRHDKKSAAQIVNFLRFACARNKLNKLQRARKVAIELGIVLSKAWRRHSARTAYLLMGGAAVKVQAAFRAFQVRRAMVVVTPPPVDAAAGPPLHQRVKWQMAPGFAAAQSGSAPRRAPSTPLGAFGDEHSSQH